MGKIKRTNWSFYLVSIRYWLGFLLCCMIGSGYFLYLVSDGFPRGVGTYLWFPLIIWCAYSAGALTRWPKGRPNLFLFWILVVCVHLIVLSPLIIGGAFSLYQWLVVEPDCGISDLCRDLVDTWSPLKFGLLLSSFGLGMAWLVPLLEMRISRRSTARLQRRLETRE